MKIPKLIHQTLPDKSAIPVEFQQNVNALKSLNPDWTHILYDDQDIESFIVRNYDADVLTTYLSINRLYGAARADLFRYLVMLKEGGVYLDIKSGCIAPFESIIQDDDEYLLSRWCDAPGEGYEGWGVHPRDGVQREFQNWHIICTAGHPLLHAVVEHVLGRLRNYKLFRHGIGRHGVVRTTGPIAYTEALTPLLTKHNHRIIDGAAVGLRYTTIRPDTENHAHVVLFEKHYSQVSMPIISSGRQTSFHTLLFNGLRGAKRMMNRLEPKA